MTDKERLRVETQKRDAEIRRRVREGRYDVQRRRTLPLWWYTADPGDVWPHLLAGEPEPKG